MIIKNLNYFFQSFFIYFLFLIFKILGLKLSSNLGGKIISVIGPFFRSKSRINSNLKIAFPDIKDQEMDKIINDMWNNYGKLFAEYIFMKDFRMSEKNKLVEIEGEEVIKKIKNSGKPVIFVSGHFSNFELMAMHIEKCGIKLATIYRPLNNYFINPFMEKIRKKYICKHQIKKGISGLKETLSLFKQGYSVALMIDQRVSEGIKCKFFEKDALTTSIPAQFIKRFNCDVVPVYIERLSGIRFKMTIFEPIKFEEKSNEKFITEELNLYLENLIKRRPGHWIWTHGRWK